MGRVGLEGTTGGPISLLKQGPLEYSTEYSTNNSELWIYLKKPNYTSTVHDKEEKFCELFAQKYFGILLKKFLNI